MRVTKTVIHSCAWEQVRNGVLDFIEAGYNPARKHAKNEMLSPVEFERQHPARRQGVEKTRAYSVVSPGIAIDLPPAGSLDLM